MNNISLFNLNVANLLFSDYISISIAHKNGYSCFLNSHMIYEHYKNPLFSNVLSEACFVLPDGVPILYAMRYFGNISQERVAGNDVIYALIKKAMEEKLRVFLFGSTENVLEIISKKLSDIMVAHSFYSPQFLPIDEYDLENQANIINSFEPDIVLVSLGCPKQEIWMSKMKNKISAHMYGLGGAFLLYAGIDARAPKVVRDMGLEWLFRLMLEPKRLFMRYMTANSFFLFLLIKALGKKLLNKKLVKKLKTSIILKYL